MTEWIVTSSALIMIVIALRGLLKGKISLRLQYGLWALVLLRLLIPFSIADSAISIANILSVPAVSEADSGVADYRESIDTLRNDYIQRGETVTNQELREQALQALRDKAQTKLEQEYEQSGTQIQTPEIREEIRQQAQQQAAAISFAAMVTDVLPYLWLAGVVLVGTVLIGSNLHFGWKLRRSRKELDIPQVPRKVYLTDYVATPCLFGIGKPDIYLTGEVMEDARMRSHVLAHEMSHYRQGDHIWSVLRCVCLVLHWYNPLVWVAAILSKQDAELACDEATIRNLGEEERVAYGRTLIGMTCVRRDPRNLMLTATTMLGTKKTLKERISLIARKPQMALYTLVACILVAAVAVGCTFTGVPEKNEEQLLLDRCREAVEYIHNLEHFEITEHYEIIEESDYVFGHSPIEARYVHSGDDWYHTRITADWTWRFLERDGKQYRKDITGAVPDEEIPDGWRPEDLSENYYAKHAWIMEIIWGEDTVEFLTYTGNGDGYEGGTLTPLTVSSTTEGSVEWITVEFECIAEQTVNDTEQGALWILTFRFDLYSGDVTEVKREIIMENREIHVAGNNGGTEYIDFRSTSTLSIYPGTEGDMSAIIDGIYYDEIVTVVPTPEDPTEPNVGPVPDDLEAQARILEFQNLLTSEDSYWYWRAMGTVFEETEDISLKYIFYNGLKPEDRLQRDTFTDNEVAFLKSFAKNTMGDEAAWKGSVKMPREYVSNVLEDYFGVSLEDVIIPEDWTYFAETDSYYCIRLDAYGIENREAIHVESVHLEDNGLVYVYWTTSRWIMDTRGDQDAYIIPQEKLSMVTVLAEQPDGSYLVLMNMPVEAEEPADPVPYITNIVDRTEEEKLSVGTALELFFMDGEYRYYFPGVKSQYITVYFSDGSSENIITALQTERATIADLDTYGIHYIKNPVE